MGPDTIYCLLYTAIADGIDRHLAGWLDRLEVTLCADGAVLVRGVAREATPIPDSFLYGHLPRRAYASVFEILSVGNGSYQRNDGARAFSTWCHGATVMAVVNALSSCLITRVHGEHDQWRRLEYANGRKVVDASSAFGLPQEQHYDVLFWPDPTIFDMAVVTLERIAAWLGPISCLVPGLCIELTDQRHAPARHITCHEPKGLAGYVRAQSQGKGLLDTPLTTRRAVVLPEPAHWPASDREATIDAAIQFIDTPQRCVALHVNAHPLLLTADLDDLLDTALAPVGERPLFRETTGAYVAISAWLHAPGLAVNSRGSEGCDLNA